VSSDTKPLPSRTYNAKSVQSGRIETFHLCILHISPLSVLKAICHTLQDVIAEFERRAYRYSKFVYPWFIDEEVEQLRLRMTKTGSIISGSVALSVFNREYHLEDELDLITGFFPAFEWCDFLESIGYSLESCDIFQNYNPSSAVLDLAYARYGPTGIVSLRRFRRITDIQHLLTEVGTQAEEDIRNCST